jgi:thiol-disulfide isomerase/thioredoxin
LINITDDKNDTIQTITSKDGNFNFNANVRQTTPEGIGVIDIQNGKEAKPLRKFIALSKESLIIMDNGKVSSYSGSKVMSEYSLLVNTMRQLEDSFMINSKAFQEADKAGNDALMYEIDRRNQLTRANYLNAIKKFGKNNFEKPLAPFILYSTQQLFTEPEDEKFLSEMLDFGIKGKYNSNWHQRFMQLADMRTRLMIGKKAPDFTLKTSDGKDVSLSSMQGKYVLVDFWASWCGPCRKEVPNMKKVYEVYKPKGLEILGVSIDDSRQKWTRALKEDETKWIHVLDANEDPSKKVGSIYQVESIPKMLLLDKSGVIIAKDLRGEAIQQKLATLLP